MPCAPLATLCAPLVGLVSASSAATSDAGRASRVRSVRGGHDDSEMGHSEGTRRPLQSESNTVNRETQDLSPPVKALLIRMEDIIGHACFNGNIQNYGPSGSFEDAGRSFRYPVTFNEGGKDRKHHTVSPDMDAEVLRTGRYKFGANELNVFGALEQVVDMLEAEYGLRLPEAK